MPRHTLERWQCHPGGDLSHLGVSFQGKRSVASGLVSTARSKLNPMFPKDACLPVLKVQGSWRASFPRYPICSVELFWHTNNIINFTSHLSAVGVSPPFSSASADLRTIGNLGPSRLLFLPGSSHIVVEVFQGHL